MPRSEEELRAFRLIRGSRVLTSMAAVAVLGWATGASLVVGGSSAYISGNDLMMRITMYTTVPIMICLVPTGYLIQWSRSGRDRRASVSAARCAWVSWTAGCVILGTAAYHVPWLTIAPHPASARLAVAIVMTAAIQSGGLYVWLAASCHRSRVTGLTRAEMKQPKEWAYDLPKARHSSQVYFIRNGNRIKIGTTTNLRSRVSALSLRPEHVVLVVPGGRDVEQQMHALFAGYRDGNTEWFQDTGKLSTFIRTERDRFSSTR